MARESRPERRLRLAPSADPAKNLAAARFFHGHLVQELRRGLSAKEESQRFYVGACLNFAAGVVEALSVKLGLDDAGAHQPWRAKQNTDDLALFDRMRDMRIEDFHYGVLDVQSGRKWVDATNVRGITLFPAQPDAMVEETNPSGEVVRGAALVNVQTLYIEHGGTLLEAPAVCQRFIALVDSLISMILTGPKR